MAEEKAIPDETIYDFLIKGIERYGQTREGISRMAFRCDGGAIRPDVLLSPVWDAGIFEPFADEIILVTEGIRSVWDISINGRFFSFIRFGVGSPNAAHAILALSCTPCKNIIFIGSAGGLAKGQNIGDIIIPEYSVLNLFHPDKWQRINF
jgi:hypothetical protein